MIQLSEYGINIGLDQRLTVFAGPCVIENEKMVLETAAALQKICAKLDVQYVFKASYKKANRTSVSGFTSVGFAQGLEILKKVKDQFGLPIITDIHNEMETPIVAEVADILQIPAFLSRQTDLLVAAGRTDKVVNIKKGQFLAPEDMQKAAEKVASTGNENILLTERGTTFGYRNLVVDMRGLMVMRQTGYPVVYDATHSVQRPGGQGNASGGEPEFILPLAKAAIATGAVSALFMEVHPNPAEAKSDAASQLPLSQFESVLQQLVKLYDFTKENTGAAN